METDTAASGREYTAKFKEEAVRLAISSQKSRAEIARNLGIPPYLVVCWKTPLQPGVLLTDPI